jgi:hypothetical protein
MSPIISGLSMENEKLQVSVFTRVIDGRRKIEQMKQGPYFQAVIILFLIS